MEGEEEGEGEGEGEEEGEGMGKGMGWDGTIVTLVVAVFCCNGSI